jgi:ABC-type sugar transport system ATPase subunit
VGGSTARLRHPPSLTWTNLTVCLCRVEQIGAPLELYDRPANKFVGSFIQSPSMNLSMDPCNGMGLSRRPAIQLAVRRPAATI